MRISVPLAFPLLVLLIAGCDATGPADTVILNANSPEPPEVEYTFFYRTDGANAITVRSDTTDNLSSILETNGFRRSDVASARIDSVTLERVSNPKVKRSVFDYLRGATVYLGPGTDAPRIAEASFGTTDKETVKLSVRTADVTDVVKTGETPAFLQLDTTNDVPDRRDRVAITVYYRIELQGV